MTYEFRPKFIFYILKIIYEIRGYQGSRSSDEFTKIYSYFILPTWKVQSESEAPK